jgi:pimeloyl-ACP methyl ester carboxylesterase
MIKRKTKESYTDKGITDLFAMDLGGYQQWVMIRGKSRNNPILLFLHGGPGTSNIGVATDTQKLLEKNFVVVNWDQLGAGLSYRKDIPKEALTIEKMVEYTNELIQFLLKKFQKKKLYLVGHSWGSIIGILTAQKYPDSIEKYIGVSQMVVGKLNEKYAYEYCLRRAISENNRKAIKQLQKIGVPPYSDWMKGLQIRSTWSNKFGGAVKKGSLSGIYIRKMLCSKEYRISDIYRFVTGTMFSLNHMWPQVMELDLYKLIEDIKVPVYFFLGKEDYLAPSFLAEEYANTLKSDSMEIVWFKDSAHLCNIEEEEKFAIEVYKACSK